MIALPRLAPLIFAMGIASNSGLAAEPLPLPSPEGGMALYERHCVVCHGKDGKADTPVGRLLKPRPRDFTDPIDMARVTADRIYRSITQGRPGTAMAAWKEILTEAEIGDVIEYIQGLSTTRTTTTRSARQLSLDVGRRIYGRECAYCHGPEGRADTAAARILDPPPRNFADPVAMARVDDGRMYLSIFRGRPGTAMGGRGELLAPTEIIDVMRYIRTLVRPLPAGMTFAQLDIQVGNQVYGQYCAPCHGAKGDARTAIAAHLVPPPRDFTDAGGMASINDDRLAHSILRGVPGTAMAPWEGVLNKEDVRRLIVYIRAGLKGS